MPATLEKLTGTEKQVNWADNLRDKVIGIANERGTDISETLDTKTYAAWWINKFKTGSKDGGKMVKAFEHVFGVKVTVVADKPVDAPAKIAFPSRTLPQDEVKGATNFGAVVHFHPDVTREEIEEALKAIDSVAYATVRPYNEDHGVPVFHIP